MVSRGKSKLFKKKRTVNTTTPKTKAIPHKLNNDISDTIIEINKTLSSIADHPKNNSKNLAEKGKTITSQKEKILKSRIQSRKKTPYLINTKPQSIPISSSNEDENPDIETFLNEDIKTFDEKTTLRFLKEIFVSLEKENKELKNTINKLKSETNNKHKNVGSHPICDPSLQQYFGLNIEPINPKDNSEGHVFTFKFDIKLFVFSLKTDSDNADSYHYTYIESKNLDISEPLKKGCGITFKKRIAVRFFNQVFMCLSKV